ncbi:MAG: hypothetical protein ACT4TC_05050 [Myxococcaceae bacterium]
MKRAVTLLENKVRRGARERVTVSVEHQGDSTTLEWVRRDATGRVVVHEFALRTTGRWEHTHTEWRHGRVVRRNLVSVLGGQKLSRQERWKEEPVLVFAPITEGHQGFILEHAYVDEGDAYVYRLFRQEGKERVALTERFAMDAPLPALDTFEPFSAGEPLHAVEKVERRRLEGEEERTFATRIWAQRGYRVTLNEHDGKRHWRSERQFGNRYRSSDYDGDELTIIERTATGREVSERVTRTGFEQDAQLYFDETGMLERCEQRAQQPDGSRLDLLFRRRVIETPRGFEVFESEESSHTEGRRLWRRHRQAHHLKSGHQEQLLNLSQQLWDPQQNRVQAVLDNRQAWVVVNGRAQHLAGDEIRWFRSLPSRERALAVHALQDLTRHLKLRGEEGLALLPTEGHGVVRLTKWEHHLEELSSSSLVKLVFQNPLLKEQQSASATESLEPLKALAKAGLAMAERQRTA